MAQGDGQQVEWLDELVAVIRTIHEQVIHESGGVAGEHTALLYSACARPFQSAFGEVIYATPNEKISALFHGLIANHAFVDGNKRTACVFGLYALAEEGHYFTIDNRPSTFQVRLLGELAVETATNGLSVAEVRHWIERIFTP
jgi:death-on-curing family protein